VTCELLGSAPAWRAGGGVEEVVASVLGSSVLGSGIGIGNGLIHGSAFWGSGSSEGSGEALRVVGTPWPLPESGPECGL
jgi:hypothetical protein